MSKRRRISIAWGYYVMVDKLNHTLYKNGDIKPIGFYNDLESAVSGLVRIHEPRLADSDLVSYVNELKRFKVKLIKDITNAVVESNGKS